MNGTFDIRSESHIEVHKFRAGAIIIATLLALVIQASFPIHFAKAAILDLPLLVTIYFGLSRRNPSTGLLLGMVIGLLQDSLSGPTVPLGLYGIAKTVIGYLASSIGASGRALRAHLCVLHCSSGPDRPYAPYSPRTTRAMVQHAPHRRGPCQRARRGVPLPSARPPPQELAIRHTLAAIASLMDCFFVVYWASRNFLNSS
jgi:hypothetical protein